MLLRGGAATFSRRTSHHQVTHSDKPSIKPGAMPARNSLETETFAATPKITNSKHPITKPEDLNGVKIRVIPNPVFLETFKAFNANPVPMPFTELYGALESKAVDGQENPFAVILSNKFFEVNKFVSATNHVYAANIVLVSKRFWDRLSPTEQRMMNEAANEARGYQRQVSRAAAAKAVGELQAKGMQYNEVAPAEQARMRQIAKPVTDKFAATYDATLVKLYNDELARIRK